MQTVFTLLSCIPEKLKNIFKNRKMPSTKEGKFTMSGIQAKITRYAKKENLTEQGESLLKQIQKCCRC